MIIQLIYVFESEILQLSVKNIRLISLKKRIVQTAKPARDKATNFFKVPYVAYREYIQI